MPLPSGIYRRALVIGNSAYRHVAPLRNPINDADSMGHRLAELDFVVDIQKDVDADQFRRAVSLLCRELGDASETGQSCQAVVFYAGHGMQVDGANYLLPIDCEINSKFDLKQQAIVLDVLLEALEGVATSSVVLLDCCRDNPLPQTLGPAARSLAGSHGLANVRAPTGVYVAFATQPHFVALDGTGNNSPFTESLVQHVGTPGSHVSEVLMAVRREVFEKTQGQQIPWDHSALFEPFSFAPGAQLTRADGMSDEEFERQTKAELKAREESYWQLVRQSEDLDFIRSFLAQFPNSEHQRAAADRVEWLIMKGQRRRVVKWGAAALLLLACVYLLQLFYRMQPLSDADIISGDIEVHDGVTGIASSLIACRLRCVTDRFNRPCVAFSYDQQHGKCYPKHEAVFFERPSKLSRPAVYSEVMPGIRLPAETSYRIFRDLALVGEYTPTSVITKKVTGTPPTVLEEPTISRSYWLVGSGGACQRLCAELGEDCTGFSYSQAKSQCEIFKSVVSLVRDSLRRQPVPVPGTFSGFRTCTDTKAEECQFMSTEPVNTQAAAGAP
jgi:uncharacterized caspase-like protein